MNGGVKSLYSLCDWLSVLGSTSIIPFNEIGLATWFAHSCSLYDHSYSPAVVVYPEVFQPPAIGNAYRICFALGQRGRIAPDTDLIICRSHEVLTWAKQQCPNTPARLILPSIDRSIFEYDGRRKNEDICYMTRPYKHPEMAGLLRDRYGDKVVEIVGRSEAEVAEILKSAKVFVWRGDGMEGSPRPPKEALVAGCIVVGLESDLSEKYHTAFGLRCSTVDEVIQMAGEALNMTLPGDGERSVIRDCKLERADWLSLFESLSIGPGAYTLRDIGPY